MPIKKICKAKNCSNLCDYSIGYCEEHLHIPEQLKKARQQRNDRLRGTAHSRGYNKDWKRDRLIHLENEPLCRECLKDNVYTPATEVDHIIPHRGDMKKFWDKNNCQSLCKIHHSKKTASEDGGFGNTFKSIGDINK